MNKWLYEKTNKLNKKFQFKDIPFISGFFVSVLDQIDISPILGFMFLEDYKIPVYYAFGITLPINYFILYKINKSIYQKQLQESFNKYKIECKLIKIDYRPVTTVFHLKNKTDINIWVQNKNHLETMLNIQINSIKYYKDNFNRIIINCTNKKINYYKASKDKSIPIDKRLEYSFNIFKLNIKTSKVTDTKYQTIILFDSINDKSEIMAKLAGIKHRTTIDNIEIETSKETDYIAYINKAINTLDYSKDISKSTKENNIILGLNKSGNEATLNIFNICHALIAGSAGNGKSNLINILLTSLYTAKLNNILYILIDYKKSELKRYKDINNTIFASSNENILIILRLLVEEMKERQKLIDIDKFDKDIEMYNKKNKDKQIPYVVLVIEEVADLMVANKTNKEYILEFTTLLQRLIQVGRSLGFRIMLCTQYPKAEIINTVIKMNCLTRLVFGVDNKTTSNLILDNNMAVGLKKGEMVLQDKGKNSLIKVPLLNDNDIESYITDIEESYKIINNNSVLNTISTISKQLTNKSSSISTIPISISDAEKSIKSDLKLELNSIYNISNSDELLEYYMQLQVSELPSVSVTARKTNKGMTTIQKLRSELIAKNLIFIVNQKAYLNIQGNEVK